MATSGAGRAAEERESISAQARAMEGGGVSGFFARGSQERTWRCESEVSRGRGQSRKGNSNVVVNTDVARYKRKFKEQSLMLPLPMLRNWNFTTQ